MAWEDRDDPANRDLMGVPGDLLFADPLGVRDASAPIVGDGSSSPEPDSPDAGRSSIRPPNSAARLPSTLTVPLPSSPSLQGAEEESWLNIGSMLWSFASGGRQCCSMRDRNRPQDIEAAKRASMTGRPPQQCAEPHEGSRNCADPFSSDHWLDSGNDAPSDAQAAPEKEPAPRVSMPAAVQAAPSPKRGVSAPEDGGGEDELERTRPAPHKLGQNVPSPPVRRQEDSRPSSPASPPTAPVLPPLDMAALRPGGSPPKPPSSDADAARKAAPASGMPARWGWPQWALNFKSPSIEVYVTDDDAGGGRWVHAEPQSRVVDKVGNDAYLCAEYDWDGEFFVQDFGPKHVRRRGDFMSVFQLFDKAADTADDPLEQTRVGGRGQGDRGGGLSSFLNE